MARLPIPGGDKGNWGTILNEYLSQVHANDGTLKIGSVTSESIAKNAVTASAIAPNSITNTALASNSVNASIIKDGSITNDLLANRTIQEVKLASTLQEKINNPTIQDTSSEKKGIIQLTGDLGGTATSPSVVKLNGVSVSGNAASGKVLMANSGLSATWQSLPSAPVTSVAGKTGVVTLTNSDVGLGNVDNTSDESKNSAAATLTNKKISGSLNTITNIPQSSVTSLTTDLAAKQDISTKGQANGYAALDASGVVPNAQIPKRPKIYFVDDYGADPTGVNDSDTAFLAAWSAMGSGAGIIEFGVGTYRLSVGLNDASGRCLGVNQTVRGQGSGNTRIDYRGSGAFLEFRNKNFDSTSSESAGGCFGMEIWGWNGTSSNTYGIRFGDIWHMRMYDVQIAGFNRTGCIGLWGDNQVRWAERCYLDVHVSKCTECIVFESNTGDQGQPAGSFDYSTFILSVIPDKDQNGVVIRSGIPGSQVDFSGVNMTITANCVTAPTGSTNTGVLLTIGKDDTDSAKFSGELYLFAETSGSGTVGHKDINLGSTKFGASATVNAHGSINFSGNNLFQKGTATPIRFGFAGSLKNVPSLGSTGNTHAFQTLQALNHAHGTWAKSGTTYTIYPESGNIFYIDPSPGTSYSVQLNVGGLTSMPGAPPFGACVIDLWIIQPSSGGSVSFSSWFPKPPNAGSNYNFEWTDGQAPVLSSTPGKIDIIRLTTYNFSLWYGQHLTSKQVLSATKLTTARNINGISFDGTADITIFDTTKEPTIAVGTTSEWLRGDKTWQSITKTTVGLGNVDNTSDINKPISTAAQTALDGKAATNQTMYLGTTQIAINRASADLTLAGISLTSPVLGTPSSGTLTNCTGLPLTGLASASYATTNTASTLVQRDASGNFSAGTIASSNVTVSSPGTATGNVVTVDGAQTLSNKTLTNPRIGVIHDTNANTGAWIGGTASAVNFLQLGNAATGSRPLFRAQGSDTNVGIAIVPKGTGSVVVQDGSFKFVLDMYGTSSAVNYIGVSNAATGTAPFLLAQGTDTDINLNLRSKGSGVVTVNGNPVVSAVSVPAAATSTGTTGQIAYDSNYIYICTATNTWRRAAVSSW